MSASYGSETIWKIGVSKHPKKRFNEHKTANPNMIEINSLYEAKSKEHAYFIESKLKRILSHYKINGEWFTYESLDEEQFQTYCKQFEEHATIYFNIQKNLREEI